VDNIPSNSESSGRLFFYISTNKRRVITMLRCGCLPLEIENRRYRAPKILLQQRICLLCGNGVEDETHFLNLCQPLTQLRQQLYSLTSEACDPNFYHLLPEQKTAVILELCAKNSSLSTIIYNMFNLRKTLIEC
jgi:hypothetical protein